MRPVGGMIVLVAATAVAAMAVATTALGTAPGKNGPIAYVGANSRLWVVNADGTGARQLTCFASIKKPTGCTVKEPQRIHHDDPDWSPDGTKLAYSRCDNVRCRIVTVNADGTGPRSLGPAGDDRGEPSWSPDGKSIAYSRFWGGVQNNFPKYSEIYVMNTNGSGARKATSVTTTSPFSAALAHPAWSPDGNRLAYTVENSKTGDPAGARAVFVANADGSNAERVTPWSLNGDEADWSPDGQLILFRSVSKGKDQHGNFYTVRPDGGGVKKLTSFPFPKTVRSGSFSPDGKWITFARYTNTAYPSVFVMSSNGKGLKQVTASYKAGTPNGGDGIAFGADWGPAKR